MAVKQVKQQTVLRVFLNVMKMEINVKKTICLKTQEVCLMMKLEILLEQMEKSNHNKLNDSMSMVIEFNLSMMKMAATSMMANSTTIKMVTQYLKMIFKLKDWLIMLKLNPLIMTTQKFLIMVQQENLKLI